MSNPLLQADMASSQSLPPPGLVEKVSVECYVPPRKPSLVGLSRAELADAIAAIGVPAAQRKMRVQQLWQWLYVRDARHRARSATPARSAWCEICPLGRSWGRSGSRGTAWAIGQAASGCQQPGLLPGGAASGSSPTS